MNFWRWLFPGFRQGYTEALLELKKRAAEPYRQGYVDGLAEGKKLWQRTHASHFHCTPLHDYDFGRTSAFVGEGGALPV